MHVEVSELPGVEFFLLQQPDGGRHAAIGHSYQTARSYQKTDMLESCGVTVAHLVWDTQAIWVELL